MPGHFLNLGIRERIRISRHKLRRVECPIASDVGANATVLHDDLGGIVAPPRAFLVLGRNIWRGIVHLAQMEDRIVFQDTHLLRRVSVL